MNHESHWSTPIRRYRDDEVDARPDTLAVEEPLEIRLAYGAGENRGARSLSITMRTPGDDFELAAGFLFTEGILTRPEQINRIEFCGTAVEGRSTSNIVKVSLMPDVTVEMAGLERNFYTTSSCGICGKSSLDALEVKGLQAPPTDRPMVDRETIRRLPESLRRRQPLFDRTGGIHAAGLADTRGEISLVREDVGRHNAVDKLLGRQFLDGRTPLSQSILVVSGRASFELLQKALVAGVPMMVAVGAPSSLAVKMAQRFGMTLIGFTAADRFNLYCGEQRILD